MSAPHFMTSHPIVVETLHSKATNGNLMLASDELVAIHHVLTMNICTTCVESHMPSTREKEVI